MERKLLRSKAVNTSEEWERAWKTAPFLYNYGYISEKLDRTTERLDKWIKGNTKGAYFAFSCGKDGAVVYELCRRLGITDGVLGTRGEDLEYPAILEFYKTLPKGIEIRPQNISFDFLNEHPQYMFPTTHEASHWWGLKVYYPAWKGYAKDYNKDILITGNRVQDGNHCGKNGIYYYKDLQKMNPTYDWTHEEVFSAMQHFDLLYAKPFYQWKDGFSQGTHGWLERFTQHGTNKFQTMDEIMAIDSSIIPKYAHKLPLLERYCQCRGIKYYEGE